MSDFVENVMTVEKIKVDFLVVGAQKAGTTALHEMLQAHPEISLPDIKETHFFSHADRAALGRRWYLGQFRERGSDTTRIIGEIDPEYMFSGTAPKAIRAICTARKFIFLLRDPIERAFSHYRMSQRRGYEPLTFRDALLKEDARLSGEQRSFAHDHWSYAARSLYSIQITRFLQEFPDAEFLFLRSDMLDTGGYERICTFVGTSPLHSKDREVMRSNVASAPRSPFLRDLLYAPNGKSAIRRSLMRLVPAKAKRELFLWLDRRNQRPVTEGGATESINVPETVLNKMARDLEQVSLLTGLSVSDWSQNIADQLK